MRSLPDGLKPVAGAIPIPALVARLAFQAGDGTHRPIPPVRIAGAAPKSIGDDFRERFRHNKQKTLIEHIALAKKLEGKLDNFEAEFTRIKQECALNTTGGCTYTARC